MPRGDLDAFMAAVRQVESGGDYRARNAASGASGAYQFIDSTWDGYGGYRRAMDAPPQVQDRRAEQLMSQYHHRYQRWDLVAVAWHGGPSLADRARRDPGVLRGVGDGQISTAGYVARVLAAAGTGLTRPASHRQELAPWRLPRRGAPVAGRTVAIDPDRLHRLAEQLTDHLGVVEHAYHRCRGVAGDLGAGPAGHRVQVAGAHLEARLRAALADALDDWDGLRRLPRLLTRDIGYVVEVRRRVLRADRTEARRTVEGLIGTLAGHGRVARRHAAGLMRELYPAARPGPVFAGVEVRGPWAGTESIFDQFVTPFLRRRGLSPGMEKWHNPNLASDHRPEHTGAYAIDYPTWSGLDDARAVARAMGIRGWRPDSYQQHVIEVDGQRFRVQILWGARIDHADHVHVGIKRA
ncbi:transglycosylase family protein [Phytohabitans houttuyneae]|nr:transglycosylase family protein [Phytohabitans houttuyneae]